MKGQTWRLGGSERRRISNDQNLWSVKVSHCNLELQSALSGSILSAYLQMSLRNDEDNKSKHYQSETNPLDDACSQVPLPSDLCDHISDILC